MINSFTENVARIMREKREEMVPSLLKSDEELDFDMQDVVLAEATIPQTP